MIAIELLENHPETSKFIQRWYTNKMYKSFEDKDVPDEFKNYVEQRGVTEEQLATFIDINPRMLLDVFDTREAYIETFRENQLFLTKVNGEKCGEGYSSRRTAEWVAIVQAFILVEKQLKPVIENGEEIK